jgi:hypothetical protein
MLQGVKEPEFLCELREPLALSAVKTFSPLSTQRKAAEHAKKNFPIFIG